MSHKLSNIILILGLSVLLAGEIWFGYRVHVLSVEREQIKEDYSMSNSVTFGLFSVDQWRDRIAAVMSQQIHDFKLTRKQQKAMQTAVEKQLHELVDKTVAEIDKPQKSLGGKLKKFAFNAMADSGEIQAEVRPFAKTIVDKVSSPGSQDRLKSIASSKIGQLEKQTYDSTSVANYQATKYLYKKYQVSNPNQFNEKLNSRLTKVTEEIIRCVVAMFICVLIALIIWWLTRRQVHLQTTLFAMALLFAGVLLAVGLTSSVIEVDARIRRLDLMLMGEKVTFQNQVLFFQSKSIWQIVTTLISQQKPDAIVVGSLILLFVIVLPVVRLLAKGLHLFASHRTGKSKFLHYLAFESGKWDMADVMIVGMLMTFIGLNGILKSQLSNLDIHNAFLQTVTVNNTSLQPGYFVFTGYVLLALLLSFILKKQESKS